MLDELDVPYVPTIGDNDVHYGGGEAAFEGEYAVQYAALEASMEDWRQAPSPVWNPEVEELSHFQNLSFTHGGVRFFSLDWCSSASITKASTSFSNH